MKKCKENKMATISMLQMVADYAKKDKHMKTIIFHVLSYEENSISDFNVFPG